MNQKQLENIESIKKLAEAIIPITHVQKEIANMIVRLTDEIKLEEANKNISIDNIFKNELHQLWFNNMQEFYGWCNHQMKQLRPKGVCGQDMMTTSGYRDFINKYPTFKDAYNEFQKEQNKSINE